MRGCRDLRVPASSHSWLGAHGPSESSVSVRNHCPGVRSRLMNVVTAADDAPHTRFGEDRSAKRGAVMKTGRSVRMAAAGALLV